MREIYLDNSSTTKPCEQACTAAAAANAELWGNPSSLHGLGFHAQQAVEGARAAVAGILGAKASEIFFTSCGTEGNNTALRGAAAALKKRGRRIVTTAVEHPSVLQTVKALEEDGFEAVYLTPGADGTFAEKDIFSAVNENTVLVSMMHVNNETGHILPVQACRRAITAAGAPALLHVDAVQSFGKLPVNVKNFGADLLTVSGHKIHGVKGAGALYIKSGVHIKPLLYGGGQEKGIRSGTENTAAIAALGAAVHALPDIKTQLEKQRALSEYTKNALRLTGFAEINSPADGLPYILNVSVPGYRSETLLHFLEERGIYVSSGSACAKGKSSYVLSSYGISQKSADSALRISFSRFNTQSDADELVSALKAAVKTLRRSGR